LYSKSTALRITFVVFLTLLLSAVMVRADTVVRTGETVSVAEDQDVAADFYTAASIINVSGSVNGDLTAAGGRTTINGDIAKDALIIGGSVDVHGPIGDDLRIVGGEVVIAEPVTGDVFVLGGSVSILSTASVGGDVLVFAGDVVIDAPVGGDVIGRIGTLRVNGVVTGNVNVTTNQLTLGDRAAVAGTVTYASTNLVTRSPNASVTGEVVRNDPVNSKPTNSLRELLVPILSLAFSVLVFFLLSRKLLTNIVLKASERRVRPTLLGLGALLLSPLAIMILLVSVLGTFVGIVALFIYALLVLLALAATTAFAGYLALILFNQKSDEINLATLGSGIVTIILLALVPIAGPIILFLLFVATLGALVGLVLSANTK
jgi:cytoskeletal protein CcmA (bactofilin family)